MAWVQESITDGELDALREAAQRAWADDTRLSRLAGLPASVGQCYVTAAWLVHRLGGKIGVQDGHFAWISSDHHYAVDLTGHHSGITEYGPAKGYETYPRVENSRVERFVKRADRIFDALLKHGTDLMGDAYPAEEPQATSDREQFDSYWHDEPAGQPFDSDYKFFYGGGQLEASPNHSHEELAGHIGIDPNTHTGPVAAGHITVNNGKATYDVNSNVNAKALMRVFKDHAKQIGWQWGGMTNGDGEPISDEFAPKKSQMLSWAYVDGHLYLGRTSRADLLASVLRPLPGKVRGGQLRVTGRRAEVKPVDPDTLPALYEWGRDNGLKLYAWNDNVIKTIPNLQENNLGLDDELRQDTNPFFEKRVDERMPSGLYRCPSCDQLFPTWHLYQKHRREQESEGDPQEDGKFPKLNPDAPTKEPHFTEMHEEPGYMTGIAAVLPASAKVARRVDGFSKYAQIFGFDTDEGHRHYVAFLNGSPVGYASVNADRHVQMVQASVKRKGIGTALLCKMMQHYPRLATNTMHDWEAGWFRSLGWVNTKGQTWKWAAGQPPAQTLEAPIPFIYDVQEDNVTVGHAGSRTSDIPGRFTPGGIVEGTYEPGGKVKIRSMTSIPYTVRHLVELWYYTHPELEVKSVHLQDDQGKDTRLAAHIAVANCVRAFLATDSAAWDAANLLENRGGEVYVVGGAVRDAVAAKIPEDIDLMVTGLPGKEVHDALSTLGMVKVTGKDFGVLRLKRFGHEVEVALPRRERSTGPTHQDFDVEADHTMKPEDDLYRRDFTANAMAVHWRTGEVIDLFGGAADIASRTLRTINDTSLSEDPLRVVRALVAHARHGLDPDEPTRAQMTKCAHSLKYLPAERIQAELDKLMASQDPVAGIKLAHDTGVLKHILPEVESAFGYDQKNPHHAHDLGTHLLEVLARMAQMTEDIDLRYAALLHDIGKPESAWWHPEDRRSKYYEFIPDQDLIGQDEEGGPLTIHAGSAVGQDHHKVGAELVRDRLSELKFPNDRIDRISAICRFHMWSPFESTKGARKFLARVGEHADDLLLFRVADQGGKGNAIVVGEGRTPEGIRKQAELVERVRTAQQPTRQADLAVNGNDLIASGIPEGPEIGKALRHLTSKVIEDPELNTRERLLELVQTRS